MATTPTERTEQKDKTMSTDRNTTTDTVPTDELNAVHERLQKLADAAQAIVDLVNEERGDLSAGTTLFNDLRELRTKVNMATSKLSHEDACVSMRLHIMLDN